MQNIGLEKIYCCKESEFFVAVVKVESIPVTWNQGQDLDYDEFADFLSELEWTELSSREEFNECDFRVTEDIC